MGREEDLGTIIKEILEGGDGSTDAGVISNVECLVEGDVEIGTDENALAL